MALLALPYLGDFCLEQLSSFSPGSFMTYFLLVHALLTYALPQEPFPGCLI